MSSKEPFPGVPSLIYGVLCLALLACGLFLLDTASDRILAILLGLHFGNRSEISAIRRRLRESAR